MKAGFETKVSSREQSRVDRFIFRVKKRNKVTMMIAAHVDDMARVGAANGETLLKFLGEKSTMIVCRFGVTGTKTDCEEGCSFTPDRDNNRTLSMSEESHVKKPIEYFKVPKTNPVSAYPSVEFDARGENGEIVEVRYLEALGDIVWISGLTLPVTSYAVRSVTAHLDHPYPRHWSAGLQLLEHL